MVAGLSEYELEVLPELEDEAYMESGHGELGHSESVHGESLYGEGEFENGELFLDGLTQWVGDEWRAVQTPGSWQRKSALAAAKSALQAGGAALGTGLGTLAGGVGAPIGGVVGGALGSAGASLLPDQESEYEFETLGEISPVRKIYLDAMMAHEAAHAESEEEAAEEFLPLIPMLAGKLLPLAAKALPKIAGKVFPRIARAVTKSTPQLSRGISNITRTLFRNPRTRPLVRAVPTIARRAVTSVVRQAAAGRPVTPAAAQSALAQQTFRVLTQPRVTMTALRRNNVMDRRYHGATGIWPTAEPGSRQLVGQCPCCGARSVQPASRVVMSAPVPASMPVSQCGCCCRN
jgi:hypothetical protein